MASKINIEGDVAEEAAIKARVSSVTAVVQEDEFNCCARLCRFNAELLCPCHQSQFLATQDAEPVFGPAARPLPQLPITVNEEGFFVARSDFVEPVGPAFWERPKTT